MTSPTVSLDRRPVADPKTPRTGLFDTVSWKNAFYNETLAQAKPLFKRLSGQ